MSKLPDYEQLASFYLGKKYDFAAKDKILEEKVLYDAKDLTTHAMWLAPLEPTPAPLTCRGSCARLGRTAPRWGRRSRPRARRECVMRVCCVCW